MHPATKQFHMIDLVVMRAKQRGCYGDVRVMRGANYWTDHKLVKAKLRIAVLYVCGKRGEGAALFYTQTVQPQLQEMNTEAV